MTETKNKTSAKKVRRAFDPTGFLSWRDEMSLREPAYVGRSIMPVTQVELTAAVIAESLVVGVVR